MKAKVLIGGWTWRGALYREGEEVDAPAAQVRAWVASGVVEAAPAAPPAESREEKVETAEAAAPAENAAKRTKKVRRKKAG